MPKGKPRSTNPDLYGPPKDPFGAVDYLAPSEGPVAPVDQMLFQPPVPATYDTYDPPVPPAEVDGIREETDAETAWVPAAAVPRELTPEQLRIQELENQLALARGRTDPEPQLETPRQPGSDENILIHFVAEAGFTALGHVWFRGQELEFAPGSAAYRDTCDRFGHSWLALRDDDEAQERRWGEVQFRSGPWLGKSYLEAAHATYQSLKAQHGDGTVSPPTEAELTRAQAAEANRRRAAPRLPMR